MFELLGPAAALATLSFVWFPAGRLAARIKLPLITGYMIAGVISGPDMLGLLSGDGLTNLRLVNHLCLSVIALAAGAELQLTELKRIKKQVVWITLGVSACSWLLVFACNLALAPYIPFLSSLQQGIVTAISSLVATLAVARSPASAIAVLKEMEGKGAYCTLVMAVVVLKDVLVFICFALNIELAKMSGKSEASPSLWRILSDPLLSVIISIVMGIIGGQVLGAMQQPRVTNSQWSPLRLMPTNLRSRLRPAAVLAIIGCTFLLAGEARSEPLLACVTAGLVVANSRFESGSGDVMELLLGDIKALMPAVNVVFFGLVGASLKLAALRDTLWVAAVLYLARLGGIWLGSYGGALMGGSPADVRSKIWMGMVTQAGVALGLAGIVSRTFPDWGSSFGALEAGLVLLNLFTGPPLFKAAVISVGEARAIGMPALASEFDSRMKRDPSNHSLSSIPEIPVIQVTRQGADNLASAASGSLMKQLRSGISSSMELT